MIKFLEAGHKYILPIKKPTISVTKLVGLYKAPFEREYWSTYKALELIIGADEFKTYRKPILEAQDNNRLNFDQVQKDFGITEEQLKEAKKEILLSWENKSQTSLQEGSLLHEIKENLDISRKGAQHPLTKQEYIIPEVYLNRKEGIKDADNVLPEEFYDLSKLDDGYYPELIVYYEFENFVLIGQIDRCFLVSGWLGREVSISDYKTNENISTSSYNYLDRKTDYMMPPVHNLENSDYSIYGLQLSMYAYIMELYGFEVDKITLEHVGKVKNVDKLSEEEIDKLEYPILDMPFYRGECMRIIQDYEKKLKKVC